MRRSRWSMSIVLAAFLSFVSGATPATAETAPAETGSGFDSEQLFSAGIDWEPFVAADPSSSYVYLVTTSYGPKACKQCDSANILLRVSPDGGNSWGPVQFVCGASCKSNNISGPWQGDPRIRVANDGTVFVSWLDGTNPGPVVARSVDHGATFSRPVVAGQSHAGWSDYPQLVVSADGRDLYVAFNSTDPHVVASHDGGETFGNPVRLVPPTNKRTWFADGGVVAPDGTVYFAFGVENVHGTGPVELIVAKSRDQGMTWSFATIDRSEEAPSCAVPGCIPDEYQAEIVIDMDTAGTFLLAYMKNTNAGQPKQFFSRTSVDGVHWSEPSLIADQGDTNFPALSHGPGAGDFRVAWQDNRNGPYSWNTWYKRSTDGGASWIGEARLSDLGAVTFYKNAAGYVFPYGDYFGMVTDSRGTNFAIWGEGMSRPGVGGCWFTRGQ